jgi:hypothetical protein
MDRFVALPPALRLSMQMVYVCLKAVTRRFFLDFPWSSFENEQ